MWHWYEKIEEQEALLAPLLTENWPQLISTVNAALALPPELKRYLLAYGESRQGNCEAVPETEVLLRADGYSRQKLYRPALRHYEEVVRKENATITEERLRPANPAYLAHRHCAAYAHYRIAQIMLGRGELVAADKSLTAAVTSKGKNNEALKEVVLRAEIDLLRKVYDKIDPGGVSESYDWVKKLNAFAKNSLAVAGTIKPEMIAQLVSRYSKTQKDFDINFPENPPLHLMRSFFNHEQITRYVAQRITTQLSAILPRYEAIAPRIACVNALIDFKNNKKNFFNKRIPAAQKNSWVESFNEARDVLARRSLTYVDCLILARCFEELLITDNKILIDYGFRVEEFLTKIEYYYQQFLKNAPAAPKIMYRLGINYERQGLPASAAYCHYKAYQINPNHLPAQKRLKQIRKTFGDLHITEENLRLSDIIN